MQIESRFVVAHDPQESIRRRRHALAGLASGQHGVLARRQLLSLGFTPQEIKGMLADRRLLAIHRGVYAVGHGALTERSRWMAAVLACGPGALLSHRSCAALRHLRATAISYVEVIVPTERGRIAGVRPYLCRRLQAQDRDEVDGIPCTSVALTLLGLAAVLPRRGVERACDEAEVLELFDLTALDDVLERFRGARGAATLRAVRDEHPIGTTRTRRELEERALALFAHHAIPRPAVNAIVTTPSGIPREVDFLWRRERLVLETDGMRFHSTPRQIERDRRKEAELVRAGYRVVRMTWDQIVRDPSTATLTLSAALKAR
ncbi:MAG: hypothetical protein QOJ63_1266 [Solirubrobacteraceae bacterium]|nr:hypothetical protein [Solirubrobacteraceae bacterium]